MSAIDRIEIHEFTYETPNSDPIPAVSISYTGRAASLRLPNLRSWSHGGWRSRRICHAVGWTKIALAQVMTLVPQLIGKDASQREFIYDICKRALRQFDHMGYGAIDILLWDWAGKSVKQPISKMLGGWRTKLPTYASTYHGDRNGGLSSPQAYVDFAQQCYDMGYRAFKMHGWTEGNVREEVETVLKLGERFRGKMTLMLDPACELRTFADALTVGRACDEAAFMWYEDPFRDTGISIHAHRKLRQFLKTPLLQTEHVRGLEPKADFIVGDARIMCGPIPSTTSASPAP
jgi:L-alanine-DL-glutamate epimerase-like enolase superfamily enzyme